MLINPHKNRAIILIIALFCVKIANSAFEN